MTHVNFPDWITPVAVGAGFLALLVVLVGQVRLVIRKELADYRARHAKRFDGESVFDIARSEPSDLGPFFDLDSTGGFNRRPLSRPDEEIRTGIFVTFAALLVVAVICLAFWADGADAHPGVSKRATRIWQVTNISYCHTWRCVHQDPWRLRWVNTPSSWRAWTLQTEACESHHNPRAMNSSGSGAAGSMQFMPRTWAAAGGSGHPTEASIFEQRVRAWRFAARYGTQHWVCSAW